MPDEARTRGADVGPGAVTDAVNNAVTDGTMLKVYAWYDNEMGYACRMVDLACHMNEVGI